MKKLVAAFLLLFMTAGIMTLSSCSLLEEKLQDLIPEKGTVTEEESPDLIPEKGTVTEEESQDLVQEKSTVTEEEWNAAMSLRNYSIAFHDFGNIDYGLMKVTKDSAYIYISRVNKDGETEFQTAYYVMRDGEVYRLVETESGYVKEDNSSYKEDDFTLVGALHTNFYCNLDGAFEFIVYDEENKLYRLDDGQMRCEVSFKNGKIVSLNIKALPDDFLIEVSDFGTTELELPDFE